MSSIIPRYCDECTHLDEDENSVACGACVHIGTGSEDNYVCSTDHVLEIDAKIASAIAAERERCAALCDIIAEEYSKLASTRDDESLTSLCVGYGVSRECARRIRGEK